MSQFIPLAWRKQQPGSRLPELFGRERPKIEHRPAFEYREDRGGANTRIDYQLSDDGMKLRTSVVLAGRIGRDEAEELEHLFRGSWYRAVFEPLTYHLPDLTDQAAELWPLSGREHHHITRMSVTDNVADRLLPTAEQFVDMALAEPLWFEGRHMRIPA